MYIEYYGSQPYSENSYHISSWQCIFTHPKPLDRLNYESKSENNKKIKKLGYTPLFIAL
jgi:hypothetical protein